MLKLNENVSDALRNTLTVIVPLLVLYQWLPQLAMGMSVGALLISLTDLPGNRRAKTRSAVQCIAIFFLVTLVFSVSLFDPWLTGLVLVGLTFILSMMAALGVRSAASGSMGVALMVFLLGLRPQEPWAFSAYVMLGGIWFYIVVLIQVYLWPFRSLRQALQEALYTTGQFLEAKAACYDVTIPLDEGYRKTIALHLRVSDKQELVRQLLISDKAAMKKGDARILELSRQALLVIRLYEQITAMHYDYAVVRERLAGSAALPLSKKLISLLADGAKGQAINTKAFDDLLSQLQGCATDMPKAEAAVITGIATNVKAIKYALHQIKTKGVNEVLQVPTDAEAFLPDRGGYRQKLTAQLHFRSPVLRFALRLTILMGIGYTAAHLFADDNYSYWLLLTILIVARPRLAVTWQRNRERLVGTFAGVIMAALMIWLLKGAVPLLVIASLALFGFFAWNRVRYSWSVACVTICVLVSLSVYRGEPLLLLSARVWYSVLGCALAIAGIFLFPVWSRAELEELVQHAVAANRTFLDAIAQAKSLPEVWLARKEAHVRLARLSEGIGHARVEPGKGNLSQLEHIQVLNYRINAVIISLFLTGRPGKPESINRSLNSLDSFLQRKKVGDEPVNMAGLLKGTQLLESLTMDLARQRVQ